MQGPVFDILLLLLMILFFGIHQRNRPQLYFRFWFIGWLLELCSFAVWEVPLTHGPAFLLQKSVRYDLVLCAGLAFAMSFLVTPERQRKTVLLAVTIAVPSCVGVDLQVFHPFSPRIIQTLIILLAALGHALAVVTTHLELPRTWKLRRAAIFAFCVAAGSYIIVRVLLNPSWPVISTIQSEIFLVAAIYYATIFGLRSVDGLVGTLGFATWSIFYQLNDVLEVGNHEILRNFYIFWNIPKYFVGFAMVLRIFEEASDEKARLAQQFQALYKDFHVLYENHPQPMWIDMPHTGLFVAVNQAAVERYGYTQEESLGLGLHDLELPTPETETLEQIMPMPADARQSRMRCKDGQQVWVNIHERPITFHGMDARLIAARDLTDLVEFNSVMAHRMFHDELTGLPNRALLTDRLQQVMATSVRSGDPMALLVIDIDHFKRINDTYGHAMGDACLKEAAERLRSRIRKVDTVARMGGEEFMAVVGGVHSAADAQKVAEELLQAFDQPMVLGGITIPLTISIGMALYPQDGLEAETLQKAADAALYRAKQEGRNCIRVAPGLAQMVTMP